MSPSEFVSKATSILPTILIGAITGLERRPGFFSLTPYQTVLLDSGPACARGSIGPVKIQHEEEEQCSGEAGRGRLYRLRCLEAGAPLSDSKIAGGWRDESRILLILKRIWRGSVRHET